MSFYLRLAVTPSTSALPCAATVPCWHHPPFPCLQSPLGFSLCFFCDRQDALFVPWLDVGRGALLSQDAGQKTFCAPAAEPSQMFTLDPEQRKIDILSLGLPAEELAYYPVAKRGQCPGSLEPAGSRLRCF